MLKFLSIFIAIVLFISCQSENKQSEQESDLELDTPMDQPIQMDGMDPAAQPPTSDVNIPAGPDGVVHHYICTDKCSGGHSENPGTCPVCGKQLAHNQAWHDAQVQQPQQQQQPNQFGPRTDQPTQPNQPTPPTPPSDQPAEVNIPAGPDGIVHHYICTSRCAGGVSEGPGVCSVCGKQLAHNKAWHNQ